MTGEEALNEIMEMMATYQSMPNDLELGGVMRIRLREIENRLEGI